MGQQRLDGLALLCQIHSFIPEVVAGPAEVDVRHMPTTILPIAGKSSQLLYYPVLVCEVLLKYPYQSNGEVPFSSD